NLVVESMSDDSNCHYIPSDSDTQHSPSSDNVIDHLSQASIASLKRRRSDLRGDSTTKAAFSYQRRQKRQRTWRLEQRFADKDEAIGCINEEAMWSINYTNRTSDGTKVYYRCKRVKKSVQCEAGLYLLYVHTSPDVVLY